MSSTRLAIVGGPRLPMDAVFVVTSATRSLVAFFLSSRATFEPPPIARQHHKCASLERKIIAAQEQDQTNT
jgi:hypothetical protein